jgi:hypothetical protein
MIAATCMNRNMPLWLHQLLHVDGLTYE